MRGRITETSSKGLTDYIELAFWLPVLSHLINRLLWKLSRALTALTLILVICKPLGM